MRTTGSVSMLLVVVAGLVCLSSSPARGQDVAISGSQFASVLTVGGDMGGTYLTSGGNGSLPSIGFFWDGDTGGLTFSPEDASLPARIRADVDALHLAASFVGTDVPVRSLLGGVVLASDSPSQRYLADANDNDGAANHIWYENKVGEPGDPVDFRMMQLTEESGGTLYVNGPVVQNHTFDLAETFWESEPIVPGELLAIDPERPNAVRRASAAYQGTLLGVASTNPGFLLGGAPFSLADLEETWGREIVDEYLRERPALELEVFAEVPGFESAAQRLASEGSYLAYQELAQREAAGPDGQMIARQISDATPAEMTVAYEAARHDFETTMFDRTLSRFFDERFSAVALAGRVPVKVDASFGAISPGDYLTSSPAPGVAMKASGPGPVIGTALEDHAGGEGVIEVFVHRGWYGGTGSNVAGTALASRLPELDPRDRKIAVLERRLAVLERALAELTEPRLSPRVAAP